MRKRTRDWPVTVYRYRVYPEGGAGKHPHLVEHAGLPDAVREQAYAMRRLWNRLVALRDVTREYLRDARNVLDKSEAKVVWQQLNECQRRACDASKLEWEARDAVLDDFEVACREAPKRRARWGQMHPGEPMSAHCGEPWYQGGPLERIRIPHRFSGKGGTDAKRLIGSRGSRFCIHSLPPLQAYATNRQDDRRLRLAPATFGINGTKTVPGQAWPMVVRLHRPLPDGAIVKRAVLTGEYVQRDHGWRFHVCLSLEVPPGTPEEPNWRVAALDIGWRVREGYLRVGALADSDGNRLELRLPLDMSTGQTRRHGEPGTWDEVYALDGKIGDAAESIKARIREDLSGVELPVEIRRSLAALVKMRQGGIVRLCRALQAAGQAPECCRAIGAWVKENDRLRHIRDDAAERMVGRRRWIYQNIAAWLAARYDVIVLEDGLDLSLLGLRQTGEEKNRALEAAQRYRQIAAPGELREALVHACSKAGTELRGGEMAGSTTTCHVCGGQAEAGPRLMLSCPNGHTWDQDENAALNLLAGLLSQTQDGTNTETDLRVLAQLPLAGGDPVPERLGRYLGDVLGGIVEAIATDSPPGGRVERNEFATRL